MTARRDRHRHREQQRERRRVPETATRFRSTPAAAATRRHARRQAPAHQSGSPPAPRACSLPPPHRCTRRPAVHPPAPIGARDHVTGALGGGRCKPWLRSVSAISLLICFARRCRQPKLPGSANRIVVLIVTATLTDIPMPGMALALGPLGTGKGGFQLRRRGHTQLAALQAGPHPPMAPAQPHRLDAPLRGGVGEAQLPHRVVEQAREPAP